ncbi:NTP transferase domain-containing protein [candidate division WOR-3 bacterium]|nr:NTP transferase domain-containing protein [candidate division WOR-3 bacterium]
MTAIVLAAGKSKRMGAPVPKVLLPIAGRPLLSYVLASARAAEATRVIVVVGAQKEEVMASFERVGVEFVVQTGQHGTADAVLACRDLLNDDEECVVLCGDAPLIRPATIQRLIQARRAAGADVAVFTARLADPAGYGRVVRAEGDFIERIVEKRDAAPEVLAIHEVNSGAYSFLWGRVRPALERIKPSPVSGEYYLTDIVREVRSDGGQAVAVLADDPDEMLGANTPEELVLLERGLAARREPSAD